MKNITVSAPLEPEIRGYTITRLCSRGSDYLASNGIIYLSGGSWLWFMIATVCGTGINVIIDYLGQKKVFGKRTAHPFRTKRRKTLYILVRLYYGIPGFLTVTLLYKIIGVPYYLSSGVVTVALWLVSYKNSKKVFSEAPESFPFVVRSMYYMYLKIKYSRFGT